MGDYPMILAIDPGPAKSAWCFYDQDTLLAGISENEALVAQIPTYPVERMAVEMIASYGMPVGREVFETCVWIGRFIQAWGKPYQFVYRKDVKIHLCGSLKANDANIRRALIDRFGSPGTKKAPGRTYGLKKDEWAALGVAVTAFDQRRPA
jgi:hypothetical protein